MEQDHPPSALFDYPFVFGGEVSLVVRLKPKQGEQAQNLFLEVSQEFSELTIAELGMSLASKDPSYFSRFVRREIETSLG